MTYSSLSMTGNTLSRDRRNKNFGVRNQNAIDYRDLRGRATRLGPITNTVILIVLACLLGLLYLTQVTKTDAYGYSIDKLRTQQQTLQRENENLQLTSAQMQSLERVQSSPQATALAPVSPSGTVKQ